MIDKYLYVNYYLKSPILNSIYSNLAKQKLFRILNQAQNDFYLIYSELENR